MKFYKRFPGDIMKKTSGLTMAQFGAYDRLIDWCYANEKPVDPEEVYTITHAQTPADRRDVDRVLAKFFTRDADGYRQERVEETIAEALPKIEAARENGKKGGRPKKVTEEKPTGLFAETQCEPNAKTSQSQSSSLRSEEEKGAKAPSSAKPTIPCPYQSIVDLYHLHLSGLPRVKLMPAVRQKALRKVWGWVLSSTKSDGTRRAETVEQALEWLAGYFARAAKNDFLTGKAPRGAGHENWQCDLDFLLTDKGMKQVIEKTQEAA